MIMMIQAIYNGISIYESCLTKENSAEFDSILLTSFAED
jgi:hypothetical protein